MEGAVGDAADHGAVLSHDGNAAVAAVHDQARNVLLGQVGQLLAKDVFQRNQPAWASSIRSSWTWVLVGHGLLSMIIPVQPITPCSGADPDDIEAG